MKWPNTNNMLLYDLIITVWLFHHPWEQRRSNEDGDKQMVSKSYRWKEEEAFWKFMSHSVSNIWSIWLFYQWKRQRSLVLTSKLLNCLSYPFTSVLRQYRWFSLKCWFSRHIYIIIVVLTLKSVRKTILYVELSLMSLPFCLLDCISDSESVLCGSLSGHVDQLLLSSHMVAV